MLAAFIIIDDEDDDDKRGWRNVMRILIIPVLLIPLESEKH